MGCLEYIVKIQNPKSKIKRGAIYPLQTTPLTDAKSFFIVGDVRLGSEILLI